MSQRRLSVVNLYPDVKVARPMTCREAWKQGIGGTPLPFPSARTGGPRRSSLLLRGNILQRHQQEEPYALRARPEARPQAVRAEDAPIEDVPSEAAPDTEAGEAAIAAGVRVEVEEVAGSI